MKKIILLILLLLPLSITAASDVNISSVSSDFLSVVQEKQDNNTTLAVYGSNFSDLIFDDQVNIYLGDIMGQDISGNSEAINVTFNLTKDGIDNGDYRLRIKNGDDIIFESDFKITVFNPYNQAYEKPKLKKFLNKSKNKKSTKRRVGLNVHQTMAATADEDDEYLDKLQNSNTKWVREHFSHELMFGDDQAGWVTRYDKIMKQYKDENIRVVGMLAYDKNQDYTNPSIGAWKDYVRYTVKRYRNYVDVWEVWNEPDSDDYLKPSDMNEYKPILKSGYRLIKYYDPNSKVLNGGVADITHLKFIDSLYRRGHKYFDALNIHLYYCQSYQLNGNNGLQQNEWQDLERVIFKKNRNKKVWITEIGCSTNTTKINQNTQRDYLKKSTKFLLNRGYVQVVMLYTLRDRDLADSYEAKFGMMDLDFNNKKVWKWYRRLPKK